MTIVATLLMVERALKAAEALAAEGIEAEVIDLRWVRPLDLPTVKASVEKTGRLVVAEEQVHAGGWGATVISELAQAGVAVRHAAAPGQPPGRLPDPVHAAARGPRRPVGRRHHRRSTGRRGTMTGTAARPVEAPRRSRAGRSRHRARRDDRTPGAARPPLHRQRLQHGQPLHDRDPAVHDRRPHVGGLHGRHGRRAGDHRRDHPRRAGAPASSVAARPTPRVRGGRWSHPPTTSCATAASRCRRSPASTSRSGTSSGGLSACLSIGCGEA